LFTSYPSILGIELNTGFDDDSFTVYDHPKVLILKKTGAFDPAAVMPQPDLSLATRRDLIRLSRLPPRHHG
jgi:hypothetical protein